MSWLRSPDSLAGLRPVAELDGPGEERCPFLRHDTLVFLSDRPRGLGGWDIYRSILRDGHWTPAVNLGPRINSPHDEYRPVLSSDMQSQFLVFSSDRPGGQGGFDLYIVAPD